MTEKAFEEFYKQTQIEIDEELFREFEEAWQPTSFGNLEDKFNSAHAVLVKKFKIPRSTYVNFLFKKAGLDKLPEKVRKDILEQCMINSKSTEINFTTFEAIKGLVKFVKENCDLNSWK